MSNDVVISVQNPSKSYRIGAKEQGYKTFREAIIDGFKAPFRNFRRLRNLTKFEDSPSKEQGAGGMEQGVESLTLSLAPWNAKLFHRGILLHAPRSPLPAPCSPLHAPRRRLPTTPSGLSRAFLLK